MLDTIIAQMVLNLRKQSDFIFLTIKFLVTKIYLKSFKLSDSNTFMNGERNNILIYLFNEDKMTDSS
jgi:hypothetical protein